MTEQIRYRTALRTQIQKGKPEGLETKRAQRIREAIGWEGGTLDKPRKHTITTLTSGIEVYFLKPGKEVANSKRPNPHDMTPIVGDADKRLRFDEIWSYLSKISMIDREMFKAVLTLIYRNAYLLDHVEIAGKLRYQPSGDISGCIADMEDRIGDVLPFGLMGLLHFLDILGWNEDVKYHTEKNRPTFTGNYQFAVGRINTLLSCIRVPYQTTSFVWHVLDNQDNRSNIDFLMDYETMQQFAKSRGTCTPTKKDLLEWLAPYIVSPEE